MAMSPSEIVERCETVMAHAWMVRTFVKHAPEAESFPELMEVARTVFDVSRALETRRDDPAAYLHMLRKKIGRMRKAAEKFRHDAPLASDHTNFRQAVLSIDGCVRSLEDLLAAAGPAPAAPAGSAAADPAPQAQPGTIVEIDEDQTE